MTKLEETFNLPTAIENLQNAANQVDETYQDETQLEEYANELLDMVEKADDPYLEMDSYKKELHSYADEMMTEFRDIVTIAKDSEPRHTGEMLTAAASMAKLALEARRMVMDAKLRSIDLQLRKKKLLPPEEKNAPITGTQIDRDELLRIAKEARKR